MCAMMRSDGLRWADSPPLVRLAAPVGDQGRLGLVPFGALDAVVLAQGGQILDELGVLVLLEVLGRQQVRLDLVDVPVSGSLVQAQLRERVARLPLVSPGLCQRPLILDTHFD